MRYARPASALALLLLASGTTMAGAHSDRLSECLVRSVTEDDRTALVRWTFGAVASHPAVADMATITPPQWDAMSKRGAQVFEKLIADTCVGEARDAIHYEGMAGYKRAFETLGATAMGGLMTDPAVTAAMEGLNRHLDEERLLEALVTGEARGKRLERKD